MTTGSKSVGSITTRPCVGTALTANESNRTSQGSGGFLTTKVWNGGDRSIPLEKPKRNVREYVVPIQVAIKTRNGGVRYETRLQKRSFLEYSPRKREVHDVPHPYTVTIVNDDRPLTGPYRVWNKWKGGSYFSGMEWTGAYHGIIGVSGVNYVAPLTWDANDELKLIGKLKEAIDGSDFNMSVFLAEGTQSLDMITNAASTIYRSYRAARKGRFDLAGEILRKGAYLSPRAAAKVSKSKSTANSWLELQYGWIPLLQDAKAGAEQLAHRMGIPFQKRYQVRRRKTGSLPLSSGMVDDQPGFSTRKTVIDVQYIAYVKEQSSSVALSGILDPELVAWELLPYSFVADWFIPIGDYLEARAFSNRIGVGSYIRTERKVETVKDFVGNAKPNTNPSYFDVVYTSCPKSGGYSRTVINRTVSSTLSVPTPEFKSLKKVASWQHCANAVALLTQVFKTK